MISYKILCVITYVRVVVNHGNQPIVMLQTMMNDTHRAQKALLSWHDHDYDFPTRDKFDAVTLIDLEP